MNLIGQLAVIFLNFFDRRDNFSTFAEASTATPVLHCLEKIGRLLAATDNPREVQKSLNSSLCTALGK